MASKYGYDEHGPTIPISHAAMKLPRAMLGHALPLPRSVTLSVFYARPEYEVGTVADIQMVAEIEATYYAPLDALFVVENPRSFSVNTFCAEFMRNRSLARSDACAFRSFPGGVIGADVATVIDDFLSRGAPVFEVIYDGAPGRLAFVHVDEYPEARVLSKDGTDELTAVYQEMAKGCDGR